MDNRDVDHGTEYWNITIESRFDIPPPMLTPGQVVPLSVKFSGSASAKEGWTPPGARFAVRHGQGIQRDHPARRPTVLQSCRPQGAGFEDLDTDRSPRHSREDVPSLGVLVELRGMQCGLDISV